MKVSTVAISGLNELSRSKSKTRAKSRSRNTNPGDENEKVEKVNHGTVLRETVWKYINEFKTELNIFLLSNFSIQDNFISNFRSKNVLVGNFQ